MSVTISGDNAKLYLTIDQGGHATRAIVYNHVAEVLCHVEVEIQTFQQGDLIVEHDATELMQSIFSVIDKVQVNLGSVFNHIVSAGIATQRSSFVCWDKMTGEAVTPIYSWQDRRTITDIDQFSEYEETIHQLTGLYLNPHYGATKMHRCLFENKNVKAALDNDSLCMGPLASFILYHLLEEKPFVIDPANASRTLLMNAESISWDSALLAIFHVPKAVLPRITLTHCDFGHIKRDDFRIPLKVCTGDQSAAVFSEGELKNDEIFVNVGTGAFILKSQKSRPDLRHEKMLASVLYVDQREKQYVVEGTVNGAARALQWCAQQTGIEDYKNNLDNWCSIYTNPPLFLNGISGVGSPFWLADFQSRFVEYDHQFNAKIASIDVPDVNKQHQFVSVLESIVFLIAFNISTIRRITGDYNKIRIAGGLANSSALCQKLANITRHEIQQAASVEATSIGLLFLLMGKKSDAHQSNSVVIQCKSDKNLVERYQLWQELMNS